MSTCRKCGYERTAADAGPDYECPKCGVVYAKTIAQPATKQRPKPQAEGRRQFLSAAALCVAGGAGVWWWWRRAAVREEIVADVRSVTGEMLSAVNFGNRTVGENARFSDDAVAAIEGYRKKWFARGVVDEPDGESFRRSYADSLQRSITALKAYIGAKVSVQLQVSAPAIIQSDSAVDAAIARRDDLQVQLANELAALEGVVSKRPGYVPEDAVFGQSQIRSLAARMNIQLK